MTPKHPQDKRNWEEVIKALETEYTLSFKDICRILKVSRNWVNQYIRPYVDSIYLTNGKGGGGISWTKIASERLGKKIGNESIWFNESQFKELFTTNVSSVTKQTKVVPYAYFMSDGDAANYIQEYNELEEQLKELVLSSASRKDIKQVYEKLCYCHEKYIPDIVCELIRTGKAYPNQRGKVEQVAVDLPKISNYQRELIAVHDIKDYGDSDEIIYRNLFNKGFIRIVLSIPNEIGVVSEKIYYIEDPELINYNGGATALLEEKVWRSLK